MRTMVEVTGEREWVIKAYYESKSEIISHGFRVLKRSLELELDLISLVVNMECILEDDLSCSEQIIKIKELIKKAKL